MKEYLIYDSFFNYIVIVSRGSEVVRLINLNGFHKKGFNRIQLMHWICKMPMLIEKSPVNSMHNSVEIPVNSMHIPVNSMHNSAQALWFTARYKAPNIAE
ncbi:hypothetical protein LX87_05710 [Larkinella arboricola]|uniref:Uncharacterized protein n=1 Tax=Larkinella arboricola TaxID=643671 RepID=A0A327WFD3_LARAB|nr:hypothetical protein LX87_05710 [Larkinella arboricola]